MFLLQRRMRGAQLGHVARHQEIAAIVEALYQHLDRDHGAIATLQLQLPGVGLSVLKGRQTSLEARKIGIAEPCPDIFVQKRFERALKQPPERRIALLRAPAVTVEHADRCVHLRDQQAGLLRSTAKRSAKRLTSTHSRAVVTSTKSQPLTVDSIAIRSGSLLITLSARSEKRITGTRRTRR